MMTLDALLANHGELVRLHKHVILAPPTATKGDLSSTALTSNAASCSLTSKQDSSSSSSEGKSTAHLMTHAKKFLPEMNVNPSGRNLRGCQELQPATHVAQVPKSTENIRNENEGRVAMMVPAGAAIGVAAEDKLAVETFRCGLKMCFVCMLFYHTDVPQQTIIPNGQYYSWTCRKTDDSFRLRFKTIQHDSIL